VAQFGPNGEGDAIDYFHPIGAEWSAAYIE